MEKQPQILNSGIILKTYTFLFNASSDFCLLLITFAISLDPDQDRQNVGPDPDRQIRTDKMSVLIWIQTVWHYNSVPEFLFLKKLNLKKVSRRQQKHEKLPSMQQVNMPFMTATDGTFFDNFSIFYVKKGWHFIWIVCSKWVIISYVIFSTYLTSKLQG